MSVHNSMSSISRPGDKLTADKQKILCGGSAIVPSRKLYNISHLQRRNIIDSKVPAVRGSVLVLWMVFVIEFHKTREL